MFICCSYVTSKSLLLFSLKSSDSYSPYWLNGFVQAGWIVTRFHLILLHYQSTNLSYFEMLAGNYIFSFKESSDFQLMGSRPGNVILTWLWWLRELWKCRERARAGLNEACIVLRSWMRGQSCMSFDLSSNSGPEQLSQWLYQLFCFIFFGQI